MTKLLTSYKSKQKPPNAILHDSHLLLKNIILFPLRFKSILALQCFSKLKSCIKIKFFDKISRSTAAKLIKSSGKEFSSRSLCFQMVRMKINIIMFIFVVIWSKYLKKWKHKNFKIRILILSHLGSRPGS